MTPDEAATWGARFLRGVHLFDERAFFDAHETWEAMWRTESDPSRLLLLQGLIQIAAGFHKLTVARDAKSASRLLERGLAKLADVLPNENVPESPVESEKWSGFKAEIEGVDMADFRDRLRELARQAVLGALGPSDVPKMSGGARRSVLGDT